MAVVTEAKPRVNGARPRGYWTRDRVLHAMKTWADGHGKQPTQADWLNAGSDHPSFSTVAHKFGSWGAALAEAGFDKPRTGGNRRRSATRRKQRSAPAISEAKADTLASKVALLVAAHSELEQAQARVAELDGRIRDLAREIAR